VPTVQEVADDLGEDVDDVLEAMVAGDVHDADSLDQAADDDETVPSKGERVLSQIDRGFNTAEDRLLVEELLAELPPRDREVLYLRFFENLTQPEIAERIGVSQSYLSRILRGALLEMRRRCLSKQPDRS
jgi:RNA polymerase sigma-B factor